MGFLRKPWGCEPDLQDRMPQFGMLRHPDIRVECRLAVDLAQVLMTTLPGRRSASLFRRQAICFSYR